METFIIRGTHVIFFEKSMPDWVIFGFEVIFEVGVSSGGGVFFYGGVMFGGGAIYGGWVIFGGGVILVEDLFLVTEGATAAVLIFINREKTFKIFYIFTWKPLNIIQ